MDPVVRDLERRYQQSRDALTVRRLVRSYARAGCERSMLCTAANHPSEVGATNLGELQGVRLLLWDSPEPPRAEDFDVRLIGWRLPEELEGHVLLEVHQGRRRRVAHVPRGYEILLEVSYYGGEAVDGVQTGAAVIVGTSRTKCTAVHDIRFQHTEDLPPEALAFFGRLAEEAGATLRVESQGIVFED